MTRRKAKLGKEAAVDRQLRIAKLIAAGWISSEAEIPSDAIPVDPDLINLGGSCFRPTHFQAVQFTCIDCGLPETWKADDQQWYYETSGAPYYATATRCRECRKKEQVRKQMARRTAGHLKTDVPP